jgi:hypothetical protein
MDALDGKIYPVGTAAMTGLNWSFTVAEDDTTTPTLVDCALAFRIFELSGTPKLESLALGPKARALAPASASPALVLTLSSGLSRTTNMAKSQIGTLTITDGQLEALLGATAVIKGFRYKWIITPVGANPVATHIGGGYDGIFALGREGYGLDALAAVR